MRLASRIDRWKKIGLTLFDVNLPEKTVRTAVSMAAAFNAFGFPIELLILKHTPTIPTWPIYLSMLVGALILGTLSTGGLRGKPRWVSLLFVVNVIAVSFALYRIYASFPYFEPGTQHWLPFQATKLGALIAAMLAPGFSVGLLGIAIHVGTSVVQFQMFPLNLQSQLSAEEPWATLAFGLGAVFFLVFRMRVRQLEGRISQARSNAEAQQRLAMSFLELRDLMNTPLQSIEIAANLLKQPGENHEVILDQMRLSCDRLRDINQILRRYEHALEWKQQRGGLSDPDTFSAN